MEGEEKGMFGFNVPRGYLSLFGRGAKQWTVNCLSIILRGVLIIDISVFPDGWFILIGPLYVSPKTII